MGHHYLLSKVQAKFWGTKVALLLYFFFHTTAKNQGAWLIGWSPTVLICIKYNKNQFIHIVLSGNHYSQTPTWSQHMTKDHFVYQMSDLPTFLYFSLSEIHFVPILSKKCTIQIHAISCQVQFQTTWNMNRFHVFI